MISKGLKIFLVILLFIIIPGVLAYFIYDSFSNDKYGNYKYGFIVGVIFSVIIGIIVATRNTPRENSMSSIMKRDMEEEQEKIKNSKLWQHRDENSIDVNSVQGYYDEDKINYLKKSGTDFAVKLYKFYQDFSKILGLTRNDKISLDNCGVTEGNYGPKERIKENGIDKRWIFNQLPKATKEPQGFYFSKPPFVDEDDNSWIGRGVGSYYKSRVSNYKWFNPINCEGIIVARVDFKKVLKVSSYNKTNLNKNTMNEKDFCAKYSSGSYEHVHFFEEVNLKPETNWQSVSNKYPGLISAHQDTDARNSCLWSFDNIFHTVVWNSEAFLKDNITYRPLVKFFRKDGPLLSKLIRKHFPEQQQRQALQ